MVLKIGSSSPLKIILIYRPPKQQTEFFLELCELLTLACAASSQVILIGDFNIHVDTVCSNSTQLKTVLDCFNLTQNVNFPTRTHGHTLDLVCTSGVNNISISGHTIPIRDSGFSTSYRKISAINVNIFAASVASSTISDVFKFTCPSVIFDIYHCYY